MNYENVHNPKGTSTVHETIISHPVKTLNSKYTSSWTNQISKCCTLMRKLKEKNYIQNHTCLHLATTIPYLSAGIYYHTNTLPKQKENS